jgi:hypothetical protein
MRSTNTRCETRRSAVAFPVPDGGVGLRLP